MTDLYLVPGHGDGQAVPGVVSQPQGEGLHPELARAGGGAVVHPQHVPPPAANIFLYIIKFRFIDMQYYCVIVE